MNKLIVLVTTNNRIDSLSEVFASLSVAYGKLESTIASRMTFVLSTNSSDSLYNQKCHEIVDAHPELDIIELNNSSSRTFDQHFFCVLKKLHSRIKINYGYDYIWPLGDDDIFYEGALNTAIHLIDTYTSDSFLLPYKNPSFSLIRSTAAVFTDPQKAYECLWNRTKYGCLLFRLNDNILQLLENRQHLFKLSLTTQHFYSIYFWWNLVSMKTLGKDRCSLLLCRESLTYENPSIGKKVYKKSAIKTYLRDIPLSILLTSKILKIPRQKILQRYFLKRCTLFTCVGIIRMIRIIKNRFSSDNYQGFTVFPLQKILFLPKRSTR